MSNVYGKGGELLKDKAVDTTPARVTEHAEFNKDDCGQKS